MPNADMVIGANYGDEGKGITTARLALAHKGQRVLNVLTNGGSQRGHSVLLSDGKEHVFKHFGSGTPFGAVSYYPENFIINPLQFAKERFKIQNTFRHELPKAIRHPKCKWSTPFDMMFNQIQAMTSWYGTCGMGIWATMSRIKSSLGANFEFDWFIGLPYDKQINYLTDVRLHYSMILDTNSKYTSAFSNYFDAWYSRQLIDNFIADCWTMYENTIVDKDPEVFTKFDHIIFENGQGMLLTDDGSNNSERTPSATGVDSLSYFHDLNCINNLKIHYVTRPYVTRHGSDIFEEEKLGCKIDKNTEINQYNQWQHKFKYSKLSIPALESNIKNDSWHLSFTEFFPRVSYQIDVTHCDEMDRTKEFQRIFKGQLFTHGGDISLSFSGSRVVEI